MYECQTCALRGICPTKGPHGWCANYTSRAKEYFYGKKESSKRTDDEKLGRGG